MLDGADTRTFKDASPNLLGLAYRILGSLADAEDAVQDTFLKWANADRAAIVNPPAWLTTICTRRCLDLLRAAHRSRVDYVGDWLPEPIQTSIEDDIEYNLELASSLKVAFLLMLERLSPKERAAYLLHEIFEVPYVAIAETLAVQESACRKLVSRAKAHIDQAKIRYTTPIERQNELLSAFQIAITGGTTGQLASLLSDDIRLTTDGGGKVPALLETLHGSIKVTTFLTEKLHEYWQEFQWETVDINGGSGVLLRHLGHIVATVSFAYNESGQATNIYIMRNPDKLENLGKISIN